MKLNLEFKHEDLFDDTFKEQENKIYDIMKRIHKSMLNAVQDGDGREGKIYDATGVCIGQFSIKPR